MAKTLYCSILLLFCLFAMDINATPTGNRVAQVARSHIGDFKWSRASSHSTGSGTNKVNVFIVDVLTEAGSNVPYRGLFTGPIGVEDWGNPDSMYLKDDLCWTNDDSPHIGDVISDGVHVAIVTGDRKTTSVSNKKQEIVESSWGFDTSGTYAYWRNIC